MADILPSDLPAAPNVPTGAALVIDTGTEVQKATPAQVVESGRPTATQPEALAGSNNNASMSPLRVKEAIDARSFATSADLTDVQFEIMKQGPVADWKTGETAAEQTARLQAFAASAGAFGGGKITEGDFALTASMDLRGFDVEIDVNPATIFDTSAATGSALTLGGAVLAGGGDMMTALPDLAAPIDIDDQTVLFANPPALVKGDIFIVYDSADFSWSPARNYYRAGEFMRVLDISGSTVTIDAPAARAYVPGPTMQMWKPEMRSVRWSGGQFKGNPAYGNGSGLMLFQAYSPLITNLRSGEGNITGMAALRRCYGGLLDGLVSWDGSPNVTLNYAINMIACHGVTIRNAQIRSTRHAVTMTGGGVPVSIPNRFCVVEGGLIKGGLWAVDMHGANDRCGVRGAQVFGGIQLAGRGAWVDGCHVTGNMNSSSDPGACIRTTDEVLDANISIKNVTVDDEGTQRSMILLQQLPSGGSLNVESVDFVSNSTTPDFVVNIGFNAGWTGTADVNVTGVRGQSATTCPIVEVNAPDGDIRHIKISDINGASVRTNAVGDLIDIRNVSSSDVIIEAVEVNLIGASQVVMDNIVGRPTVRYGGDAMIAVRGPSGYSSDYRVDISKVACVGLLEAPVVDVVMDGAATALAKHVRIQDCVGIAPRFIGKAERLDIVGNDTRNAVTTGIAIDLRSHTARQDITIADNYVVRSNKCGMELAGPGLGSETILKITGNQSYNNNQDNSAPANNSKSSVRADGFGRVELHSNTFGDDQPFPTQTIVDALQNVTTVLEYGNAVIGTVTGRPRTSVGAYEELYWRSTSQIVNDSNLSGRVSAQYAAVRSSLVLPFSVPNAYAPASLVTAFSANSDIAFAPGAVSTTTSTAQRVVQIAGGRADLNGGGITVDFGDATANSAISARNLRNGSIALATGRNVYRLVGLSGDNGLFENLSVSSADQVANGPGNDDAAWRVVGAGNVHRNIKFDKFDVATRVYGSNSIFEDCRWTNYVKGLALSNCSGFRGRNLIFEGISPAATTSAGHNAITGGGASDCQIIGGRIGAPGVAGSGEHGFYLSSDTGSEMVGVMVADFWVYSPGQCGYKFRGLKNAVFSNCHARDMSFGNAPGTNEDGWRTERSIGLAMVGCSSGVVSGSSGGYYGQILKACQKVDVRGHSIRDSVSHGLVIEDVSSADTHGPDMASGDINWQGTITNAGGAAIYFNHTVLPIMGDITIDVTINGAVGAPVDLSGIGSIAAGKKVIIRGTYRGCGAPLPPSTAQIDLSGLVPAGRTGSWGILRPETSLVLNSFDTAPPRAVTFAMEDCIARLIKDGIWPKLVGLGFLAATSQANSLRNWKRPGLYDMVPSGAPVFTANSGWAGDDVSAYLSATLPWSSFALDNMAFGIWATTNVADNSGAIGTTSTTGADNKAHITPRTTGDQFTARVNSATDTPIANTDSTGHYTASRTGSGNQLLYKNGALVMTGAVTSTGLPGGNVALLRNGSGFNPVRLGAWYVGQGLTGPEVANLHAALNIYMTAVAAA